MARAIPPERILLVEGVDDKHVVRHLCKSHQDVPPFEIKELNGFPQLKAEIGPQIRVSGRTALGILADANADPTRRWQEIAEQLTRIGVYPGPEIAKTGAIVEYHPRVGIWLMPDNTGPGQIEDFITKLIPERDPVWPRANVTLIEFQSATGSFRRTRSCGLRSMLGLQLAKSQGKWARPSESGTWTRQ